MDKKSNIVGWYCYLDYLDQGVPTLKGQIKKVDDYGVVLVEEINRNPDKEEFVPWCVISKIAKRP